MEPAALANLGGNVVLDPRGNRIRLPLFSIPLSSIPSR